MDESLPISASTFDLYSALKKNLCFLLLGYSFKLRPKSCALYNRLSYDYQFIN